MNTVASLDNIKLRQANDRYGWVNTITVLSSIFVLSLAAFFVWTYLSPWAVIVIAPFLGAQIYKVTIVMHDCCHNSLFGSKQLNQRVGTVAGLFICTKFSNFCRQHWKHHASYGSDDDPQGDDYLNLDTARTSTLLWHLVRPLLGFNVWKLSVFRPDRTASAQEPTRQARAQTQTKPYVFLLRTVAVQILISAFATGGFRIPLLAALYPLCAATFALFFSQTRGFVEHVALPGVSPIRHARTHAPNLLDRLFFYTLNFNYHIEHHRFPQVPSYYLPRIHEEIRYDASYGDLSPSVLHTVLKRLHA